MSNPTLRELYDRFLVAINAICADTGQPVLASIMELHNPGDFLREHVAHALGTKDVHVPGVRDARFGWIIIVPKSHGKLVCEHLGSPHTSELPIQPPAEDQAVVITSAVVQQLLDRLERKEQRRQEENQ